jgi:hypothetical protein
MDQGIPDRYTEQEHHLSVVRVDSQHTKALGITSCIKAYRRDTPNENAISQWHGQLHSMPIAEAAGITTSEGSIQ